MRLGVTLPTGSQINELILLYAYGGRWISNDSFWWRNSCRFRILCATRIRCSVLVYLGKTKRRIKQVLSNRLIIADSNKHSKTTWYCTKFALKGAVFSRNRAYQLKWFYEYIRKGEDILTPVDVKYGYDVINDHSESSDGEVKAERALTSHFVTKFGYDHHYVDPDLK